VQEPDLMGELHTVHRVRQVEHDDFVLWLSGPASSAARPMPDPRQPVAGGLNRCVIEVNDLAAEVVATAAAGIALRNAIVTRPGGKQILADDPDGDPIARFEAPR
jgi:glyoxylase I family protein